MLQPTYMLAGPRRRRGQGRSRRSHRRIGSHSGGQVKGACAALFQICHTTLHLRFRRLLQLHL